MYRKRPEADHTPESCTPHTEGLSPRAGCLRPQSEKCVGGHSAECADGDNRCSRFWQKLPDSGCVRQAVRRPGGAGGSVSGDRHGQVYSLYLPGFL